MHARTAPDKARSSSTRKSLAVDGHPSRRIALLVLIIAAHYLIIAWLLSQSPAERKSDAHGETLITISPASGNRTAAEPPQPVERAHALVRAPLPPPLSPMPNLSAEAPETGGAAGVQGGGSACQLTADAALAIQQDPMAMAELENLPAGVRSKADAVMLWNGAWFDQAPQGADSTIPEASPGGLHLVIERIVSAAPTQCRDEAMVGPVFVPIPWVNERPCWLLDRGCGGGLTCFPSHHTARQSTNYSALSRQKLSDRPILLTLAKLMNPLLKPLSRPAVYPDDNKGAKGDTAMTSSLKFTSAVGLVMLCIASTAIASSHREAPGITKMPKVDNTDTYAFRSYEPGAPRLRDTHGKFSAR